jgi:hypothetical protein
MDKVLHQSLQLKTRRYLFDFLVWTNPSHIISGVLGITAALILWSMLPHKPQTAKEVQTVAYEPQQDPAVMAQRVAMVHLFGQDVTAAPAAAQVTANISVEGVIYSEDKDSALAVLKVNDKSDVYKVGDTLSDGEKLLAIAPTAVQLGSSGTPRVIELQQDFGDGASGLLLAGMPGRSNPFPGMQAGQGAYAPVLKPVVLSPDSDPLSQLRSLRQQLIPQLPVATTKTPAEQAAKTHHY